MTVDLGCTPNPFPFNYLKALRSLMLLIPPKENVDNDEQVYKEPQKIVGSSFIRPCSGRKKRKCCRFLSFLCLQPSHPCRCLLPQYSQQHYQHPSATIASPAVFLRPCHDLLQTSKTLSVIREQCSILRFLHIKYIHCTLSVQQARSSKEGPLSEVETACLQRGSNSCIRLPT
jgi:hypothetical protein